MVRIGLLVKHRHLSIEEYDFCPCEDLEWCRSVPDKYKVAYKKGKRQKYGSYGVQADVCIGAYIQYALKHDDVKVDYILPNEVTKARLDKNDLNFLIGYGITEAHYADKSKNKRESMKLKACLLEAKNMYPPQEYQQLISSKINYYSYLQRKKVPVLPTFTMDAEEYHRIGHDAAMKKMFGFWQSRDLGEVIAKPVLGMAGADCEIFKATESGRKGLSSHFRKCMKKYPGLVVQKCVKGFGMSKDCPELRMYYMGTSSGDEYKYSASANANCVVSHPTWEGGSLKVPAKLKVDAQKILSKLPAIVMPNGAKVPRLITRLDMGWRMDGRYQPFLNEVELTPSLYLYKPLRKQMLDYVACCAKQMVRITRRYVNHVRSTSAKTVTGSRKVMKPQFLKHRLFFKS